MANEIVLSGSDFRALVNPDSARALCENLGAGNAPRESELKRATLPKGGGLAWSVSSALGEQTEKELVGVILWQRSKGVLWAGNSAAPGVAPALVTDDMITARVVNRDAPAGFWQSVADAKNPDGTYSWGKLPQNEWGSGKGAGKLCKQQIIVHLLRADELLPMVITVQPSSLTAWRKFMVSMGVENIIYWQAIVGLSLVKAESQDGNVYAMISGRVIARLEPEIIPRVEAMRRVSEEIVAAALSGRAGIADDATAVPF